MAGLFDITECYRSKIYTLSNNGKVLPLMRQENFQQQIKKIYKQYYKYFKQTDNLDLIDILSYMEEGTNLYIDMCRSDSLEEQYLNIIDNFMDIIAETISKLKKQKVFTKVNRSLTRRQSYSEKSNNKRLNHSYNLFELADLLEQLNIEPNLVDTLRTKKVYKLVEFGKLCIKLRELRLPN